MEYILIILIFGCCATIYKIIVEARKKEQERNELIDELGDDYEEYIKRRKSK